MLRAQRQNTRQRAGNGDGFNIVIGSAVLFYHLQRFTVEWVRHNANACRACVCQASACFRRLVCAAQFAQLHLPPRARAKIIGKITRCIIGIAQQHNIAIVQASRWDSILSNMISKGAGMGLSESFVRTIYTAIHEESVRLQDDILSGKTEE